jgi:hypothetical protein
MLRSTGVRVPTGQYRGAMLGSIEGQHWTVQWLRWAVQRGDIGQYRELCWTVQRGDDGQYIMVTLGSTERRCWAVQRADAGQYLTVMLGSTEGVTLAVQRGDAGQYRGQHWVV